MAAVELQQKLLAKIQQDLLECAICLDTFDEDKKQPRRLPCDHSFCSTCLSKIAKDNRVTCPQCKREHTVDNNDITTLRKDNIRRNLMDIVTQADPASGQEIATEKCTACDEDFPAVKRCTECDEKMCEECTKAHNRMKKNSKHTLSDMQSRKEHPNEIGYGSEKVTVSGNGSRLHMCEKEGHTTNVLELYCMTCDTPSCKKCVQKAHGGHRISALTNVCSEKRAELLRVTSELQNANADRKETDIKQLLDKTKENEKMLTGCIEQQFGLFQNAMLAKKDALVNDVHRFTNNNVQYLEKQLKSISTWMHTFKQLLEKSESATREDDVKFMQLYKGIADMAAKLKQTRPSVTAEVQELRYSQTCTTDDFVKITAELGKVTEQEPSVGTDNYVLLHSDSILAADDQSPHTWSVVSNQEHWVEVLKSLGVCSNPRSTESRQADSICESTGFVPMMEEPQTASRDTEETLKKEYVAKISELNVPRGKALLYNEMCTRQCVQPRFKTWGLIGDWTVTGNDVSMYSKSQDDARQCMHLLSESIKLENVPVKPESMIVLESDKWLQLIRTLNDRYPQQIAIDVSHVTREVACYSSNSIFLSDVTDSVRLFLLNNEIKTVKLTYTKPVIDVLMRHKKALKTLCQSYSQFCVQIKREDAKTVAITGIGIGMTQCTRGVYALAKKCAFEKDDEDRFASESEGDDDEDDDTGTRFDETTASLIDLKDFTPYVAIDGIGPTVCCIALPGDDHVLYAVEGDMTSLPVDVFVNPADKKLHHTGGLAKAMVRKGGRSIQLECTTYIDKHGVLAEGDIFCSKAGALPASMIIHAVGPKWINGKHGEIDTLASAVRKCLSTAAEKRWTSIAIPAIGTGAFEFPPELATRCIVHTVQDFLKAKPHCSLRDIYVCDIVPGTVAQFTEQLKESVDAADVIVAAKNENSSSGRVPVVVSTREGGLMLH